MLYIINIMGDGRSSVFAELGRLPGITVNVAPATHGV